MLSLLLCFAFARWPESSLLEAAAFRVGIDDHGFSDTFEASVWGSTQAKKYLADLIDTSTIEVVDVFKNPVPYSYYLQKKSIFEFDSTNNKYVEIIKIKKRPVMIYVPGIFNNSKDSQSRRALDEYKQLGYHVFILPNPWSEEYITANQNASKPGDILAEGKALLALSSAVVRSIDPSLIDGVELTGASYGGFIVGVMSALDNTALFNRGTTIISPPLDFRYSLPYMDTLMDTELDRAYQYNYWDLFKIASNYFSAVFASDLSPKSKESAKPFIAKQGFHDSIVTTIKTYDKVHSAGWIPDFANDDDKLKWEKSIRFMKYFTDYAPETLTMLESEASNLSFWIEETLNNGMEIRLLTTSNDFLNPPVFKTKKDFYLLPQGVYLELPSGGHLGFLALPWYKNFKKLAWNITTEDYSVKMLADLSP